MNNQRRRFLVWDAFRAHLTPSVKESVRMKYNSDLCVIPGDCTSKLQPTIQIAEIYEEWLFDGPVEKTKGGNRRAPSKIVMLKWIKQAWTLSPQTSSENLLKSVAFPML